MNLFDPVVTPLVKPKPPSATSIPAILKSLQDEWVCSYTVLYVTCNICYMCYISGVAKNERG